MNINPISDTTKHKPPIDAYNIAYNVKATLLQETKFWLVKKFHYQTSPLQLSR
jgi:hypothetical protein